MSLPRALSSVFLPPFPPPLPSARGSPSLPAPLPIHRSPHLYLDLVNHLRIYHDDLLSPHARLALSYYLDLVDRKRGRTNLLGAVGRLIPILELVNDWLRERGAMVSWEEREWEEGGFGFVARTVGRVGRLVDVVELRVEPEGSPPGTTTAGAFVRTKYWASWTGDSLLFGEITRNGYGDNRATQVLVAECRGDPVVIPAQGRVGSLNQVGALAGLALVGEASERAWVEGRTGYVPIPQRSPAPSPTVPYYAPPAYPSSSPSLRFTTPSSPLPSPRSAVPSPRSEAPAPPHSPSQATDALLSSVTSLSPSFKSQLVQSLLQRAMGNSDLAPVVAQLTNVVLSSGPTTKSADPSHSDAEKQRGRDETQGLIMDALKAALKAAVEKAGGPSSVHLDGLNKVVAALVEAGVLDRTTVGALMKELDLGSGQGAGDNGYH